LLTQVLSISVLFIAYLSVLFIFSSIRIRSIYLRFIRFLLLTDQRHTRRTSFTARLSVSASSDRVSKNLSAFSNQLAKLELVSE